MSVFFFNDTATTEIYTLSLHDALPILEVESGTLNFWAGGYSTGSYEAPAGTTLIFGGGVMTLETNSSVTGPGMTGLDRKSTRLNSSHSLSSTAVSCLNKDFSVNATTLN